MQANKPWMKIFKGIALNKYTKLNIKSVKRKAIPYKSYVKERAPEANKNKDTQNHLKRKIIYEIFMYFHMKL